MPATIAFSHQPKGSRYYLGLALASKRELADPERQRKLLMFCGHGEKLGDFANTNG